MSSITELKFSTDNMDLVAMTSAASFHVSCSSLLFSPEFCLLLHKVQIGLLSQFLLFGRFLIFIVLVMGMLMAKLLYENISQKMNEFVKKLCHPANCMGCFLKEHACFSTSV